MQRQTHILALAVATLVLADTAAAASTVNEYAKVDASQFANSAFVKGNDSAKSAATATGNQVYWFDDVNNLRGAALGSAADKILTVQNTTIRADSSTPWGGRIAKLTQGSVDYGKSTFSMDLGAGLLTSDQSGLQVSSSSIQVIDYGNAGSNVVHFDFKVGLWTGTTLTQANALSQLNFNTLFGSAPASTGSVSYLGNNTFRFTESSVSGVSGTTLSISSALAGSFVRSLDVISFVNETGGSFADDWVDLAGTRTLTAIAPVPEPASAGLMLVGGLFGFMRLWRRKLQAEADA